jgi:D-lactate dehydrogenase (cytochrome)
MHKVVSNDDWKALQATLPKELILTNPVELIPYEVDGSLGLGEVEGVVLARDAADVAKIVRWARDRKVPVIARGAGTGLSGGAVAPLGGIMLSLARMKQVVELDEAGRSVVVQPGIVHLFLDEFVKTKGLYYPPDPASGRACTLGGNLGENAGGPHCFKYGVTTNYVNGLEVALADGRLIRTGGRAFDYPEYDLTALLVGSEGTLGIVTEAELRLVRNVPGIKTLMAIFDSVETAGEAVSAVIAGGLVPATLEMMDRTMIGIVENYVHAGLPVDAEALLIIEADGHTASLDPQMSEIVEVMKAQGARELRLAQNAAERDKIWFARKSAFGAIAQISPAYLIVDGTVPRSKLARALAEINRICAAHDLRVGYVFHAGDGNLHPLILFNPQDPAMVERVHAAGQEVMELCVAIGGTITGEHGVGSEKRQYMRLMFNEDELRVMQDIKDLFDPQAILNPGKIVPELTSATVAPSPAQQPAVAGGIWAPRSTEEAADGLRWLQGERRSVRILGGGTKSQSMPSADVTLSTQALCGVKAFELNDLFVTVGAGTTLAELQSFLAERKVWTPLASPWPEATIGGIVASNFNAPLRMRYGAIRDLLLALTVVMPDGRVIRAGKPVVKNVAGYDLSKLHVGAQGTLGLITDVSLKLLPLPRSRATLVIPAGTLADALVLGQRLLKVCLVSTALLLLKGRSVAGIPAPYALLYTAEGVLEDTQAELAEARALVPSEGVAAVEGLAGSDVWAEWMRDAAGETVVRAGIAPKDLPTFLVNAAPALGDAPFVADIASGLVYTRGQSVVMLRQAARSLGGYACVATGRGDGAPRWGYVSDSLDLMLGLKRKWDPAELLNPGAFI